MKMNKNKTNLAGAYDLVDYQSEEAIAFIWEQWGVVNNHEARIKRLEAMLRDLEKRLIEKNKNPVGVA